MKVIATKLGTNQQVTEHRGLLEKVVRTIVPPANPRTEPLFAKVRLWWIEIDDAGVPQRELGFGEKGEPLVASPLGENVGYWTDSSMTFSDGEYEAVAPEAFEGYWSRFVATWWADRVRNNDA